MKKLKDQKNRRILQDSTIRKAYANATRSIVMGLATIFIVSLPVLHGIAHGDEWFEPISEVAYYNSENQESINIEIQDTTQPPTTTSVSVTSIITTSTTVTETTQTTTESTTDVLERDNISEEYYEEEEEIDSYEDYESEDYEEDEYEDNDDYSYSEDGYAGTFTAKYYPGSPGSYGYSGRDLISGYSVASNYFEQGTLLYISGGGLDGTYRVDDTSWEMPGSVIDFFYTYDSVPPDFAYNGVYSIEVYVIG